MTANDKGNLNSDFRPGVPGDAKDFEGVRDFEEKIHPPLIPNKQQNVDGVPERTSFETATDAQRPVAAPELPTAERTHGSTVTEKLEGFDPVRGRGLTRQEILEIQIQPLLGERTEENTSKLLNTSSSTMAWVAKGDGWYVWEPEGTEPEEFPPGLVPQEEEWTWKGNVTVDSPDVKPKKGKRYKFRPKSTGGVKGHRYLDSAEIIRLYNGWYSSRVRETTETCGSACIKNAVSTSKITELQVSHEQDGIVFKGVLDISTQLPKGCICKIGYVQSVNSTYHRYTMMSYLRKTTEIYETCSAPDGDGKSYPYYRAPVIANSNSLHDEPGILIQAFRRYVKPGEHLSVHKNIQTEVFIQDRKQKVINTILKGTVSCNVDAETGQTYFEKIDDSFHGRTV